MVFEPGLSRLRVRLSTSELSRFTIYDIMEREENQVYDQADTSDGFGISGDREDRTTDRKTTDTFEMWY